MKSLQGQFLVASPHLSDSNFHRSVVLMLEHNDEGASGLILNRPGASTVNKIWESLGEEGVETDMPVFVGGPVRGPVLALHTSERLGETEVIRDVYVTSQREHLFRLVRQTDHPYRLFTGYSGWGAGQLEGELTHGGWLTAAASIDDVFFDPDQLWDRIARRINLEILSAVVDVAAAPQDASLN